ncbi:SDR family oxidoreductase [Deinococcus navajonensis]|uniref:SDR family oxidoreductase n=1 Tax=Deinococcus navajonensis TaxID=309884 RepID=A0ABV8XKE9_9DEIO
MKYTMTDARIALVTGGNRGIGLEVCRQLARQGLHVLLAARNPAQGEAAATAIRQEGGQVTVEPLDVQDESSVQTLAERTPRVDVIVNNAAVLLHEGGNALTIPPAAYRASLEVNFLGPLRLCQAFVPGMRERGYGRIVNVSSGAGQLSSMGGYAPAYSASKAALNALTRLVAHAGGPKVLVNSVDPGWVRTDMGGHHAPRSVKEGADTVVWLATLPEDGPTGGFYHDRQVIAW